MAIKKIHYDYDTESCLFSLVIKFNELIGAINKLEKKPRKKSKKHYIHPAMDINPRR